MWPSCHVTGIGSWGGWNLAGALLGTAVPLIFLAAVVALGILLVRRLRVSGANQSVAASGPAPSGREIAQARYARGEITREQYNELLSHLSAGKGD